MGERTIKISDEIGDRLDVFLIGCRSTGVEMTEEQIVEAALTGFFEGAEPELP